MSEPQPDDWMVKLGFSPLYIPLNELEAREEMSPVLNALSKNNFEDALLLLNMILEANPNRAVAYLYRGLVELKRKKLRRAMADINRAIQVNPHFLGAYMVRGGLYVQRKQLRLALADFEQALSINPASPEGHLGYGVALYMKGIYERRIHTFGSVIDYRYGNEELNNAIQAFQRVLDTLPDYIASEEAIIHEFLAYAHFAQLQYDHAIHHFSQAITLEPDYYVYFIRGNAYLKKEDYVNALADFEQALQLKPKAFGVRWLYRHTRKKLKQSQGE